jgi:polar amino acid transport system substrate-binding protein
VKPISFATPLLVFLLAALAVPARADPAAELAPHGTLRVAMIGDNPILFAKNPDGTEGGISVELGRYAARKLGATFQPVVYATPAAYVASFGKGEWDLAIGPRSPLTEKDSVYGPDFMLVDNIYLAAPGKSFANASKVDRHGIRVAVLLHGVPDQYLSKALKAASVVRFVTLDEIDAALRSDSVDVYASNAEFVAKAAAQVPGTAVVRGSFRTVHMAVAMPAGRSPAARQELAAIVAQAKADGLVQSDIDRRALKGARVAP